jgi:hypothetical protein
MLSEIPVKDDLLKILGNASFKAWNEIYNYVSDNYYMEILWNSGGKYGIYECKFRKSGKTLCTLYVKENSFDLLLIYGKGEREKFETLRMLFSLKAQDIYDMANTYHDGKWIYMGINDSSLYADIINMLNIKKKPNRII